ncbi:MAG TPA: lytic transglycosylase domain-containing protein [Polyangiaceae bacterium]|jgi:soluble lytic murein transglycosylase-like protein
MRPKLLSLTLGATLALSASFAQADIFQYTDADGVIHFSSTPPPGGGARVVVRGSGGSGKVGAPIVPPQDRDPARFTRYDEWIRQAAALYQIPEALVRSVIKVESDYDPRAVSSSGARGLMQLMPDTATSMQVRDSHDPRENIFGGVRLLRILANSFNGDLSLTVAAYNAGPDAVMKAGGIPAYPQTRDYVVKVLGFYRRYRSIPDVVEASLGTP